MVISRCLRCFLAAALVVAATGGCIRISVDPTCPAELRIGESGPVAANQRTPGEIATYLWEVSPSRSGTIADPTLPSTTFEAAAAGTVILRLTASDGLFQVVAECRTQVLPPAPVVSLQAEPADVVVGDNVTLTCASIGESEVASVEFDQSNGDPVNLESVSDEAVSFEATAGGDLTFICTGVGADGERSEPATIIVSVAEAPDVTDGDDDRPSRRGG